MLCTPMKQKKRFTTLFECLKIQDKNTNPIVSKKYKGIPTLNIDLISYKNTNKIKGSIKVMIKMMISLDLERAVILFPPHIQPNIHRQEILANTTEYSVL